MKHAILRFSAAFLLLVLCVSSASAWGGNQGWTYNAGHPISSSVAVAGGLVIAGDSGGSLHAVHVASGQAAWIYHGNHKVVGLPAVSGQMVVFAQADGTITALSLADGSVLWRHRPPGEGGVTLMDGAAIGDGKVFYLRADGSLSALSASDGQELWTYHTEIGRHSAPNFSDGFVFVGEYRGVFSALNPQTGERDWGGGAGGPINTPATHDGHVYFSSWDGSVQSVRIAGVIPQWRTNVGEPISTSPFVGNYGVFVGTVSGLVVALSKADGEIKWSFNTEEGIVSGTPIAADGLVFVGGGQGTLFALDAASGAVRFTFNTGGGIIGTPAYSGGILFLGSGDGKIYTFL